MQRSASGGELCVDTLEGCITVVQGCPLFRIVRATVNLLNIVCARSGWAVVSFKMKETLISVEAERGAVCGGKLCTDVIESRTFWYGHIIIPIGDCERAKTCH
jgi:hypothetical protein